MWTLTSFLGAIKRYRKIETEEITNMDRPMIRTISVKKSKWDLGWFIGAVILGTLAVFYRNLFEPFGQFIPAAIIILYFFLRISMSIKEKSVDEFADSLYFLGFIFTFIAMLVSFRIYGGDSKFNTSEIISNLGIALSATVVGVILRIIALHIGRVADLATIHPPNIAQIADREGADAGELAKDFIDAARALGRLRRQQLPRLASAMEETTIALTKHAERLSNETERAAVVFENARRRTVDELNNLGTAIQASARRQAEVTDAALAHLADRLREAEAPAQLLMNQIGSGTSGLREGLDRLGKVTTALATEVASASSALSESLGGLRDLATTVTSANLSLMKSIESIEEMEIRIQTAVDQVKPAVGETIRQIVNSRTKVDESVRSVTQSIASFQGGVDEAYLVLRKSLENR